MKDKLTDVQKLVLDMVRVKRNHRIPADKQHENVAEHSYSVAVLCLHLFDALKPDLSLEKILTYALVHDFPERGQESDTNTYANTDERKSKEEREVEEIRKLSEEFPEFDRMNNAIVEYEKREDEESLFVWSVDKMQAIILGEIDGWWPYENYGVTWEQYCVKCDEFVEKCHPSLKDVFEEVVRESKKTYYDNPANK